MHCEPNFSAMSATTAGLETAAELTATLSAPASNRARSKVETSLQENPRKFWGYTAFNLAVCLTVGVFCVLLFFKPVE